MLQRKPDKSSFLTKAVRVYFDDVERLHNELAAACESVSIETKDYQVETIADLRDYPKPRVRGLRLAGWKPSVTVSFIGVGAMVHRHDDDNLAFGLAEKVRQLLVPCRRRPAWMFGNLAPSIALLVGASASVFIRKSNAVGTSSRAVAVGVVALGVLVAVCSAYQVMLRGSVVYPVARRDNPSFLRRNADALTVNAVVAVATALATYFLTRLA